MNIGYSFKNLTESMAKASGRNLNISPKQSIEICNHIRGRSLIQAKRLLTQSADMKFPIPLKRFTNGPGHKPGMGAGRYYPKACLEILSIIESAEANAKNKGLNVQDLKLVHIATQTAPKSWHYGRKKRSVFKAAHIEVVLEEVKGLSEKKSKDKSSKTIKNSMEKKSQ